MSAPFDRGDYARVGPVDLGEWSPLDDPERRDDLKVAARRGRSWPISTGSDAASTRRERRAGRRRAVLR
jgi:hypothetical protein